MFKSNQIIFKKIILCYILLSFLIMNYNKITKSWTKYYLNPILGDNKTGTVFDPFVLRHDNLFKMYVSWRKKGAIAISTSKDGIKWSNLQIVLNKGDSKSWESIVNRGSVIIFKNKFYLYYTGQNSGKSAIGLAISEDGYNFTREKNNPILKPYFNYEKQSVMIPHVIYDNDENIFKMWYSAGEASEPDVICYALSKNGINWIKYKNNPIFKPSIDKSSFDFYKVGGSDVHKISKNKYLMFYIGYSDINTARIFIAKSENGIHNWTRNKKPIIEPTKGKFDNDACYKPSAIFNKKTKSIIIYYNGRNGYNEYIGFAFSRIKKS